MSRSLRHTGLDDSAPLRTARAVLAADAVQLADLVEPVVRRWLDEAVPG